MNKKPVILVIDDEESMCEGCRQVLEDEGYRARIACEGERGVRMVRRMKPKAVLIDLKMPVIDGMQVLKKIREIDPDIVCIVITGYGTIDSAVEAMKRGASDYLCKPFDQTRLLESVKSGLKRSNLEEEPISLRSSDVGTANRESVVAVLERAAREPEFIIRLTEEGSGALEEYDLSSEEKAALISGDIKWVESHIGKLNERQKTWLNCRLQQERW